jgi:hypothetical protein
MKTIQAVQCHSCKKLIDAERQFVIFSGTVEQQYKPSTKSTKVNLTEAIFCDAGCLTTHLQDRLER